jgi:hypothetical protein
LNELLDVLKERPGLIQLGTGFGWISAIHIVLDELAVVRRGLGKHLGVL